MSRDSIPRVGSYAFCFTKQQSTTYTTPSIVTDVSATLLATTIFRVYLGAGLNASICCAGDSPA